MSKPNAKTLYGRTLSLTGITASSVSGDALSALVLETLEAGIHGISFSPYLPGQSPGDQISEGQIRDRMQIIQPYVRWVRSFSCTDGNEAIPVIAKENGLGTLVGAWLEGDLDKNAVEMDNAIRLAREGAVDILAVGNEVLLRGDLSEDQLLGYIEQAKSAVPGIPVGYVDAYFEVVDHPRITEACDVILANCYPFWEGCAAEYAILYMKDMYRRAASVAGGKPVIVSETGWPNVGSAEGAAVPSQDAAMRYFVDTYRWAAEDGVDVFYFSSFDEDWKTGAEGDVGAYWGLWDKDGRPKYWR